MDRFAAIVLIYSIAVNLLGIAWGWLRNDMWSGLNVSLIGGTGVSIIMLGLGFAIWVLLGAPQEGIIRQVSDICETPAALQDAQQRHACANR